MAFCLFAFAREASRARRGGGGGGGGRRAGNSLMIHNYNLWARKWPPHLHAARRSLARLCGPEEGRKRQVGRLNGPQNANMAKISFNYCAHVTSSAQRRRRRRRRAYAPPPIVSPELCRGRRAAPIGLHHCAGGTWAASGRISVFRLRAARRTLASPAVGAVSSVGGAAHPSPLSPVLFRVRLLSWRWAWRRRAARPPARAPPALGWSQRQGFCAESGR